MSLPWVGSYIHQLHMAVAALPYAARCTAHHPSAGAWCQITWSAYAPYTPALVLRRAGNKTEKSVSYCDIGYEVLWNSVPYSLCVPDISARKKNHNAIEFLSKLAICLSYQCCLMTTGLRKDIQHHIDIAVFSQLQITNSDTRQLMTFQRGDHRWIILSLSGVCPTIRVLSYSSCHRSTQSISKWIFRNLALQGLTREICQRKLTFKRGTNNSCLPTFSSSWSNAMCRTRKKNNSSGTVSSWNNSVYDITPCSKT